jgi:hypothetical protein
LSAFFAENEINVLTICLQELNGLLRCSKLDTNLQAGPWKDWDKSYKYMDISCKRGYLKCMCKDFIPD